MTSIIKKTVLHVVLPIFLGFLVYAFFRGIYIIDPGRIYFPFFDPGICPEWIRYNVPDGLWFYALLSSIALIWHNNRGKIFIIWLLIAILTGLMFEILQSMSLVRGTFDWLDILSYIAAMSVFLINFKIFKPADKHNLTK